MKNVLALLILSFFLACKRDGELPLSDIPGRILMQADHNAAFIYTISSGETAAFTYGTPLRWSHNGQMIAFSDEHYYRVLLTSTREEILHFVKPANSVICWSPDDNTLAYTSGHKLVFFHRFTNTRDTIPLPEALLFDRGIDWSFDGNSLVLAARNPDSYVGTLLCSIQRDGSNFKSLFIGGVEYPRFAPDGSSIAFEDYYSIKTIYTDGSNVQLLENGAQHPCWSANSEVLMYNQLKIISLNESQSNIVAREIHGDQRERILLEARILIDWLPVQ